MACKVKDSKGPDINRPNNPPITYGPGEETTLETRKGSPTSDFHEGSAGSERGSKRHSTTNGELSNNQDNVDSHSELSEENQMFLNDDDEEEDGFHGGGPNGQNYLFSTYGFNPGRSPIPLETRIRRAKIVQEILAQFDLESVMNRYRGNVINGSYSRSLRTRLYDQWLSDTMGNKRGPDSDREWNERFQKKIMEDYERKQAEQERRLAEAELKRVLHLKLQGVMPAHDKTRDGQKEQKQSKAEKRFERQTAKSHQSLYRKPNDIETQMEILRRDESEVKSRRKNTENDNVICQENGENSEDSDNKNSSEENSESNDQRSHSGRSKAERLVANPELDDLYEEEDLEQLYREAEKLVRITSKK
ncbi:uncharacterized protein LOC101852370 [Aplysia californica]|uniref:Uncharacterized protein LOC101852370 n=1 Tax=Aplysia californica TaxID=6500 RepID=A0ABM0K8U1_APLCA|nr:uncharacterized protein LOC101852370 [Aplysia californica]